MRLAQAFIMRRLFGNERKILNTESPGRLNRLKPDVSLLAIASTNLGLNILLCLFNFYYVKVFLEHHHITQAWLYYAQVSSLIGSFLIGPLIAYAQDYGCAIWRSRRRTIIFFGPIFAFVFTIPWFPWYDVKDENDPHNWAPGVHLTVVLLLWSTCYFIVNACNCGLFAETSTDHSQRVKALTYNQIAGCLASASVFPVDALSQSFRNFRVFQICCVLVAIIAAACFVFTGLKASDVIAHTGGGRSAKNEALEAEADEEEAGEDAIFTLDSRKQSTPSCPMYRFKSLVAYLTTVRQILGNRNFCCTLIANFMHFFRVCVASNFLAVYTEALISESIFPTGSIITAVYYLTAQLTPKLVFVLVCPLIQICGVYRTLLCTFVLTWLNAAIGLFLGVYVGYDALIGTLLLESILVVFQDAYVMLYSEVVDEDMRKHKRRFPASTVLFTMTTVCLQTSTALAPMIVVRALNFGDYDQYKDNIRLAPAHTKRVMFLVAACVPAFAALVSFLSMCFFKREKRHGPTKNSKRTVVVKETLLDNGEQNGMI